MANENVPTVLDRILRWLESGDEECQLAAIQELETINFSSEAIILRLEELVLQKTGEVRDAALRALSLTTSQFVSSKQTPMSKSNRAMILREIDTWETHGLIESHRSLVIKRRYDFDIEPGIPTNPKSKETQTDEIKEPAPVPEQQPSHHEAKPAEPRPSLTQILLSENSIRIYLYLGAFFVIASAAILAAVIEAARLPILLIATLIFAGGAVGLKKRLPQPSFALAVVFSFLLPIDAIVVADSLNLSLRGNHFYWTGLFLLMTVIWGLGTWFYESRMFSLAGFLAFILGILRFDNAIALSNDWTVFTIGIATLIGLVFVRLLQNWKNKKFAQPIFITAQVLQVIVLFTSLSYIGFALFGTDAPSNAWIAHTLIWLSAASFFAASNILVPLVLFPWTAVASLFLIPWLFLSAFDASASIQIVGFITSGALAAFASEFTHRAQNKSILQYSVPLLSLSMPLVVTAFLWGIIENSQYAFAVLLGAGAIYIFVNIMRPRWYIWSAALLAWLGAYFLFFTLPAMQKADVFFGYQVLIASLVLLVPELSMTRPLTFERIWNWPPVLFGALLVAFNILLAHVLLLDSDVNFGRAAITLGVYAFVFAAFATHFKQPLIGYISTASFALTVVYGLVHFDLDLWLPSLTALSVIYYLAGYFLSRNEQNKHWGSMLINSGLALGMIFSTIAVLLLKATGGWYSLVIGALFIIEMFTRRNGYLEFFAILLFSVAFVIFLSDFKVDEFPYYLYGLSLIWLASDMILHRAFKNRKTEIITRLIGGLAVFVFAMDVITNHGLPSGSASACFAVYTVFFAAYGLIYKKAELGYLSTASATVAIFYALDHFKIDAWLFPIIAVSVLYYIIGFILRRAGRPKLGEVLISSGLGLGSLTALLAPFQSGGIEKAIPIAIAATLFAVEAFALRNVWLALPANGLYLISYFTLLIELNVDQPQYFSIGAALLGMLMHYLLTHSDSKTGAFIMGTVSQLVLLGTSYIQLVSTSQVGYYFVLFFQSLIIIFYGLYIRSRSLAFAPIAIVVLATLTILYSALQNLSLVIIIGVSGLILLTLGILAVLMRERITLFVERFNDWNA